MASNDYDVYVSECISLARSLVIKSEQTINAINRYLQQVGHSVPEYSANNGEGWKEWKYYLNVNGEYYLDPLTPDSPRLGYDEKMYITSLDTQTEILFDKSTLALNPLTLSEYKGYGRYYEALVTKYPEQVELIRRILNPVDMDAAWEAKNYAILQYDTNFVDFNEFNLIDELQSWIYRFTGRYDTDAFAISHRYYAASQLGIIYLMILGEIINIRLKNCKTPFAHSYHVWNYLGDYYGLDKFKELIYHDQALWLYRNIDELVVKGGIKETLDFLKKEFSEPFGLHLKSIELEKDTVKLLESLSFEPFITKHPYGTNPAVYGTRSDVARLYDQLKGQAFLNGVLQKEKEVEVADSLKYSTRNSFATGIIECDSSQEAQVGLVNYIAERFNNWLFLAAERTSPEWQNVPGSFPLKFPLDVPGSGTVLVSPAEAAAIMMFIGRRLQNDSDDVIPSFWVREVPYMDENVDYTALIKSGTESRFLTDERIAFILDGMDDIQPRQITSVEAYLEYVDAIVNKKAVLALMVGSENDPLGKSQLREAIDCLFVDAYCKLTPFTTFSELFDFMQINMDFIGAEEYATISGQIVSMLVGNIQTNEGLSSPYFEIMEIMRLLSKYTTMFVSGQRSTYEILDWPMLGITLEEETNITEAYIPTPDIEHTVKLANFDIGGVELDSVPDSSDTETEITLSGNADAGIIHTLDEGSAYDHTVYSLQPTPGYPTITVFTPPPLLLDLYPAAIAVSLRQLSRYKFKCMRVSRWDQPGGVGDGDLLDIGFVNGVCDYAAILTFVGSGLAVVDRFYNQSPLANESDPDDILHYRSPSLDRNSGAYIANGGSIYTTGGQKHIGVAGTRRLISENISVLTNKDYAAAHTVFSTLGSLTDTGWEGGVLFNIQSPSNNNSGRLVVRRGSRQISQRHTLYFRSFNDVSTLEIARGAATGNQSTLNTGARQLTLLANYLGHTLSADYDGTNVAASFTTTGPTTPSSTSATDSYGNVIGGTSLLGGSSRFGLSELIIYNDPAHAADAAAVLADQRSAMFAGTFA